MATPTQVAARYRLDRRLGAGGMATVFLALDGVLERPVALKLLAEHLAEDENFVARFRREALAAARLQHPNIVQVFDSGMDERSGRHFIVMEFVDGPSCAELVRDEGALEVEEAVRIVRDACHGLDYAHRAGVVHRDVKPANLLLASGTGTVKLADFGIAKAAEQTRITQVGSVLGTAAYLSPEQAQGQESGPASDVYSLGVCAYQFLTGRLPHEYGSLTELALKQQNDPIEPLRTHRPEVPLALDHAIQLCLARDPEARYASTLELSEALEAGVRGEPTDATQRLTATTHALESDGTATRGREQTGATRALRTRGAPVAVPPRRPLERAAPARRAPQAATARRARRFSAIALALIILLGVAALVLASTAGDERPPERIIEQGVREQVQGLRGYIQRNTR